MISLTLLAGLVVVVAAAIAITLTDGRAVVAALFVALAVSPFVADPLPGSLEIAARLVAAALAGYVLWIVVRDGAIRSEGTAVGIAAELAVAAAAYVVGWWIEPVRPLQGSLAEQASGFALVALAILPLAGTNVLRAGIGVVLLLLGASLVMQTWLGPSPGLVQLALTALMLAVAAGLSLLVDAGDYVAKVVPAVEKVRPENEVEPTFTPTERPELEVEEPETLDEAGFEAGREVGLETTEADEEAERGAEAASAERADAIEPDSAGRRIRNPRPSIRFLGGRATVRPPTPKPNDQTATTEASDTEAEPPAIEGPSIREATGPHNPRYKRPLR